MIRRRRPVVVDDELVQAIRQNAADLRHEAEQVRLSHERMDEIAARMESLAQRLPTADDEESHD